MSPDNLDRANHWRSLAAAAWAAASEATDPQSRAMLISISTGYENLALRAEASAPCAPTVVPVVLIKKR